MDISKAFDTLSKQCIEGALDIFNFGPYLTILVRTVMKGTQSCVQNGGWLSSWFPTERGIRQGCPLGPLLLVVAVEILAITIRNNPEVTGIQIEKNNPESCRKSYNQNKTICI